jgi:pentatricopeptide repeat protein
MDSSLEGFFYKREYNLSNFNFLLQVLAEQNRFSEAVKAMEKMKVSTIVF